MRHAVLQRGEVNGSGQGPGTDARVSRSAGRAQVSAGLRAVTFSISALLWLSGVLWLWLHYAFAQQTQFGPLPNPAEPAVMRVHGLLAVCGVFLLGWIMAGHALERWKNARRRLSGLLLAAAATALIVSGYALYYTIGGAHDLASVAHETLGVASISAALAHWWRSRLSALK